MDTVHTPISTRRGRWVLVPLLALVLALLPGLLPVLVPAGLAWAAVVAPRLEASVTLEDPLGEQALIAEYGGTRVLSNENAGRGAAQGVTLKIKARRPVVGLTLPGRVAVGDVAPGQRRQVRVPLVADRFVPAGKLVLDATIADARGFDAAPLQIDLDTLPLRLPDLRVVELRTEGSGGAGGSRLIRKGEEIRVELGIRNTGQGLAKDVAITLETADPDVMILGKRSWALGEMETGMTSQATFRVLVPHGYAGPDKLPLRVALAEAHPEAARSHALDVTLSTRGDRSGPVEFLPTQREARAGVQLDGALVVDVDRPLERRREPDPQAIALVVGIENYRDRQIPDVQYAERDARVVREYFEKLLGVPSERIVMLLGADATKNSIETAIEGRLPELVARGQSDVYVYFAGHGAPDPENRTAYLVAHDTQPQFARRSGYGLERLYGALGDLGARSVTVMLDSCFSGQAGRGNDVSSLLASRPIGLELKQPPVPRGVTVLAASGGEQVSSGFEAKKHGLFTYFVLKGLRGEAAQGAKLSLAALHAYVAGAVTRQAGLMGRTQTPVLLGDGARRELSLP